MFRIYLHGPAGRARAERRAGAAVGAAAADGPAAGGPAAGGPAGAEAATDHP